mgnify:CR=1 FL=1
MRKIKTQLIYSPTDLVRYLESPFASWIDRFALEQPQLAPEPDGADPLMGLLAERGITHEDAQEQKFRDAGLNVVNVATMDASSSSQALSGGVSKQADAVELTKELLRSGVDVIAQATLVDNQFRGHADFLVKKAGASDLGDWHYEVWDTKLAQIAKPGFVLQLCCYADMLHAVQGCYAEHCVVALGNQTDEHIRLSDCIDYYGAVKQEFLKAQDGWSSEHKPDPSRSSSHGKWSEHAQSLLEERDHLSLVATITRATIDKLEAAGITTRKALASIGELSIAGVDTTALNRLSIQAQLQIESEGLDRPAYRVIPPDSIETADPIAEDGIESVIAHQARGLEALPAHSDLDVFFDIEGFPLEQGGLEYLWGVTYFDESGARCFSDWWAHDRFQEQVAFEQFIDWVYARWQQDPAMHIYHYASYETSACKRLMGRFGTRELELDALLRGDVFVDLYEVVRHSVQIGEPRYSIKNVEKLYRGKRDTDVGSGGDSVVVYEAWRQSRAASAISGGSTQAQNDALGMQGDTWQTSSVLNGIRDYNIDDCDSTQELVEWLRARQSDNGIAPVQRVVAEEHIPSDAQTELTNLRDALLRTAAEHEQSETADKRKMGQLARNLAGFLEFHRREDKPAWWRLFDRMACTPQDLLDDPGALACCTRTDTEPFLPTPRARNKAYEYRFDQEQAYKGIGRRPYLHGALNDKGYPVSVTLVDPGQTIPDGKLVIQSKDEPPADITLVANEFVPSKPIPGAIVSVVSAMNLTKLEPSAIADFLSRSKPRIKGHDGGVIATGATSEERLASTVAAVLNLDNSYLTIQGPPGTGKSYTGARIIAALCAQGKRVGISSNSHSAINNLLVKAAEHCLDVGVDATFICGKMTADIPSHLNIEQSANNKLASKCVPGVVIGTTAWGFSRNDLAGQFDVLLVDEAGQVATANLVAMSRSASNLVLLGDQMQLGQPVQGTHPADSGQSVLDYLLQDTPTVPADQGVFLATCYRMHPLINEFISSRIYEGKLKADKGTAARTILSKAGKDPHLDLAAGISFVPVTHSGNTQDSEEEVEQIKRLSDQLIGRVRTDSDGNEHTIELADMLFVAPYNLQVRRLEETLGTGARVGSVDKFQGQEAPIVFISLCTSNAADSPRGIDFLFDRNRLNVAVSRAQTLVVVVGHPELAITRVGSLDQLKKVNLLAALLSEGAA